MRFQYGMAVAFVVVGAVLGSTLALAQSADENVTPYDAGYAFAASKACTGAVLRQAPAAQAQENAAFVRGGATFELYVKQLGAEGACKAAYNLYDDKTGKVAKLLGRS